jgi:phage terminase Nu1 subunit (DNA packaging protein)
VQRYITKDFVAAMLGVEIRRVEQLEADKSDPLPVAIRNKGKANQYDIGAVLKWQNRQLLAGVSENPDGTIYDFQKERARLTHEQADKVELENTQLRGELLPVGLLEQVLIESYTNLRAHLLAAPANHAVLLYDCDNVDELRARFSEIVEKLLNELAVDELSKAALARIEGTAESADNTEATTKVKRRAVG